MRMRTDQVADRTQAARYTSYVNSSHYAVKPPKNGVIQSAIRIIRRRGGGLATSV
jgi:hypothetical protein